MTTGSNLAVVLIILGLVDLGNAGACKASVTVKAKAYSIFGNLRFPNLLWRIMSSSERKKDIQQLFNA